MKKNIKVIYWIELALLIINLIFYLMIKVIPSELNIYLVITFLLLMIIPLRLFFGNQKDKSYYTGYVNRVIITVLMSVGIIIYLLGLLLGFTRGFQFSTHTFIHSLLPLVVAIILFEYFNFLANLSLLHSVGNSFLNTFIVFKSIKSK